MYGHRIGEDKVQLAITCPAGHTFHFSVSDLDVESSACDICGHHTSISLFCEECRRYLILREAH